MTEDTNYYLKNDTMVCGNGYSFKLNNKYDAKKLMRLLNEKQDKRYLKHKLVKKIIIMEDYLKNILYQLAKQEPLLDFLDSPLKRKKHQNKVLFGDTSIMMRIIKYDTLEVLI